LTTSPTTQPEELTATSAGQWALDPTGSSVQPARDRTTIPRIEESSTATPHQNARASGSVVASPFYVGSAFASSGDLHFLD
jgi:hypothetical protein